MNIHSTLISLVLFSIIFSGNLNAHAQKIAFKKETLTAVGVRMSIEDIDGRAAVKVVKDPTVTEFDEPTYVKITAMDFENGTIEVDVLSKLLPHAPEMARGFIGLAFHIKNDNSRFEGIYLRPTNARAENQLRRNRAVQYFAFPDFKFDESRKTAPGEYESYVDLEMNKWIKMKIVVNGKKAALFIGKATQPVLLVNQLREGNSIGALGLWVDIGTEGYFSNLKITKSN